MEKIHGKTVAFVPDLDDGDRKKYAKWNTPYPERMIPKIEVVLNAMRAGITVRLPSLGDLRMAEYKFENCEPTDIGTVVTVERDGVSEDAFMPLDISHNELARACNELLTEECLLITASTTMRKIANERIEQREKSVAERKKKKRS